MKPINHNHVKRVGWSSPSNIALVKYWGKHGNQLPANASLSLTLKNSISRTIVSLPETVSAGKLKFIFGGIPAPEFEPKIESFLARVSDFFPFLNESGLLIESSNTFPHSAGIASSASSMSALALCLCEISQSITGTVLNKDEFHRQASLISRLGSGSASRSVYGGYSVWGKNSLVDDSSDEFAVPLDFEVHPVFSKMQDTILIVSSSKKKISSSSGHQLMNDHPYAAMRYEIAKKNLEIIINALKNGNTIDFMRITENEALGLHSLMMSSDPGFMLFEPGTIHLIRKIIDFREKTGHFICFTLDAGPNVHLLYPEAEKQDIADFIRGELAEHCENGRIIWDECGNGPQKIDFSREGGEGGQN
jgi:diphosphomevalonate decarboxylase